MCVLCVLEIKLPLFYVQYLKNGLFKFRKIPKIPLIIQNGHFTKSPQDRPFLLNICNFHTIHLKVEHWADGA